MPRSSLPQVATPPGRVRGKYPEHDNVTNVWKSFGNRVWAGGGQCRCHGSFLDPQLEQPWLARSCRILQCERSGSFLASLTEPCITHWGHVPALDGEPGDHDLADSETDTAIPDDDIVSLS